MKAELVKIEKKPSRYGGYFFYAFFKGVEDGKPYYTCLFPKMRNFSRWKKVMKTGLIFSELRLVKGKGNLIDADSRFKTVKE